MFDRERRQSSFSPILFALAVLLAASTPRAQTIRTSFEVAGRLVLSHSDPGTDPPNPLWENAQQTGHTSHLVDATGSVDGSALRFTLDSLTVTPPGAAISFGVVPFTVSRTWDPPGFDPPVTQTVSGWYAISWEWSDAFRLAASGFVAPLDPFRLTATLPLEPTPLGRIRVAYWADGVAPQESIGPILESNPIIGVACSEAPPRCQSEFALDGAGSSAVWLHAEVPLLGLFPSPFPDTVRLEYIVGVVALDNCAGTANPDQADRDRDGIGDVCDLCPDFATREDESAHDVDRNGIGDRCECGDQNGDGAVDVRDLIAINIALFDPARITELCDTNFDGACNVADIVGANLKIYGRAAHCSRYPPPLAGLR